MRRHYRLILLVIILFLFSNGCSLKKPGKKDYNTTITQNPQTTFDKKKAKENITKIGWQFEVRLGQDDVPYTTVYLNIVGKDRKRINLGEYDAHFKEVSPPSFKWALPQGSITQCFGWWAGSGYIFSIVRVKPDTLVVKIKELWEPYSEDECVYRDIKTIKIDKNSEIQLIVPTQTGK